VQNANAALHSRDKGDKVFFAAAEDNDVMVETQRRSDDEALRPNACAASSQ
jgi:hypothetical protein